MNMSDDFHMTIAKFETLKDGNPGPNALNRITRSQQFQVWLVAVDENKMNNLASYKRFMQLDWIYQFDCSVSLEGEPSLVVHSENHWHNTKFGDFMDPIPPEALQAPAGNENLQLNYYLNGQFDHVVKPRQG